MKEEEDKFIPKMQQMNLFNSPPQQQRTVEQIEPFVDIAERKDTWFALGVYNKRLFL